MNCQKCGAPLKVGGAFCTNCGTPVPAAAPAAKPRFCTNCGTPLAPDELVCPACGTATGKPAATPAAEPAAPAAPTPNPVPTPPKKGNKAVLVGGIAAALVLVVGGGLAVSRLLGGAAAPATAPTTEPATAPSTSATPAPAKNGGSDEAQLFATPNPVQESVTITWAVEPTITAENIEVPVQREPTREYTGLDAYGNPIYSTDYNTVLEQYSYPLCAYTKNGKTGIIKYDGTVLVGNNYEFCYVGNQAQLLVGNAFYGDSPALHDMWLVTKAGVAEKPYYGNTAACATVYYPNGWGVPCWDDTAGIGTFGEGGFVALGDDVLVTGVAALTTDLATWQKNASAGGPTNYYPVDGDSGYAGLVPVFNSKRVGTDVYEDVTVYAYGLFGVKKGGKWGYIDTTGHYVFPCEYDSSFALPAGENFSSQPYLLLNGGEDTGRPYAYTPSEGYLVLCKKAQYALYTVTGEEVIPFGTYEALRPVCGGKLWAKQGGKWGVLSLGDAATAAAEPAALTAPALPEITPEPVAATSPAGGSAAEYIFPDSDTRRLTDADLRGLSAATLRIARNEILARHGRLFDSADLQSYFNGCSWYHGTTAPAAFNFGVLNATEQANIELIKTYE